MTRSRPEEERRSVFWWTLALLLFSGSVPGTEALLFERVPDVPWQVGGHFYFYERYALGFGVDVYNEEAVAPAFLFRRRHNYQVHIKSFPIKFALAEMEEAVLRWLTGEEEEEEEETHFHHPTKNVIFHSDL